MRRALVTGGGGFIGLHLTRRLVADNFEVDILDDLSHGRKDADFMATSSLPAVRMLNIDLTVASTADACSRDYDLIYHLAAKLGVAHVTADPYSTLSSNLAILQTALAIGQAQTKLRRFTFVSTSEVYAGSFHNPEFLIPTPEDIPITLPPLDHPRTSYMLSKICGEALCRYSGLPITIVRPHNVYGPRMGHSHVIPQLLAKIYQSPPDGSLRVESPAHTRTFCYVDDAVEQILCLSETSTAEGKTVNIGCTGPEISMLQLSQKLLEITGRSLTITPAPVTPGSVPRRCPDLGSLIRLTGLAGHRVDLTEGLRRTESWYRSLWLPGDQAR